MYVWLSAVCETQPRPVLRVGVGFRCAQPNATDRGADDREGIIPIRLAGGCILGAGRSSQPHLRRVLNHENPVPNPITAAVFRFASRLRYPQLFGIVAALFIADVLVPDFIPFVDELILGLLTILLGNLRKRDETPASSR
jgi:hypothetical protein